MGRGQYNLGVQWAAYCLLVVSFYVTDTPPVIKVAVDRNLAFLPSTGDKRSIISFLVARYLGIIIIVVIIFLILVKSIKTIMIRYVIRSTQPCGIKVNCHKKQNPSIPLSYFYYCVNENISGI